MFARDGELQLRPASPADLDTLLPMVSAYHAVEQISLSRAQRADAVRTLLTDERLGGFWLLVVDQQPVGYLALTYGYSLEFGGRDAFIDELFIEAPHRGKVHGHAALQRIKHIAAAAGVRALHLEVGRNNPRAAGLYRAAGFQARDSFQLMSARLSPSDD